MVCTLDTFHREMSPLKRLLLNMKFMLLTLDVSHMEISPLNAQPSNNRAMCDTFDVFHLEMFPTKLLVRCDSLNSDSMVVIWETSIWFKSHAGPYLRMFCSISSTRCSRCLATTVGCNHLRSPGILTSEERKKLILYCIT